MCLSLSASRTYTTHTAVCYWIDEVDFGKNGVANRFNISWSLKAPPEPSWTWSGGLGLLLWLLQALSDLKNTDNETGSLCSPSLQSKMTLNIWFSRFYLQSAGVTGPHYHTLCFVVLGNWSFLQLRQALHQLNYISSQINISWVSFALTIQWSNRQ